VTPHAYSQLVRRAGREKTLVLRALSTLRDGSGKWPPSLQAVGNHAAGVHVLTLDLGGKKLTGKLLKGTALQVGIVSYTLAANAEAPEAPASPELVVAITAPLEAPLADGSTVTIGTPAVDFTAYRSRATANDTADAPANTSAERSYFVIPAYELPFVPTAGMLAIIDGQAVTIHDARPRGPAEVLGYLLAVGSKGAA
jgi:hypothetical protein